MLSWLLAGPEWEPTGFYDDGKRMGEEVGGLHVLGAMEHLLQADRDTHVVIAIGNTQTKKTLALALARNPFLHFPVLIHPRAIIQDVRRVIIGQGSIISAGAILTTDIRVGDHVLVNLNSTIGHDVHIGHYCSVMPGVNIAGEVSIGEGVLIGSGANVLNGIRVGDHSRVGAGSVVTKAVADHSTVVGVPAKPLTIFS